MLIAASDSPDASPAALRQAVKSAVQPSEALGYASIKKYAASVAPVVETLADLVNRGRGGRGATCGLVCYRTDSGGV